MPSGKTHEKINLVAFSAAVYVTCACFSYLLYGVPGLTGAAEIFAAYLFGTYLMGPDLDTNSLPYKRWGVLRFIWTPYRDVFAHRSFWTHSLIISDVIRVLYLACALGLPLLLVVAAAHPHRPLPIAEWQHWLFLHRQHAFFIFAGIASSTAVHLAADSMRVKKRKKTHKRRR